MNVRALTEFFDVRRQRHAPIALATVVETRGSTYSKAGALMLIDENGVFQGMLSGGCLEGDLAIHAQAVIETGRPQLQTYDLGADNDELWGLGVGCDGLMKVLLQPVAAANDYEPLATVLAALDGRVPAIASTIIESSLAAAPVGATLVLLDDEVSAFGLDDDIAETIAVGMRAGLATGETSSESLSRDEGEVLVLHSLIRPALRLLILGGGLDAEPLVRFTSELGWKCTVTDHRPAYIEQGNFTGAERVICSSTDDLQSNVEFDQFDAAIVMSHHLASDRAYLGYMAASDIAYVGLLGPVGRHDRLLSELGDDGKNLAGRLHGPAGLDLGSHGPAAIALSIVAQLQQLLVPD